jgi:hypothetical protein
MPFTAIYLLLKVFINFKTSFIPRPGYLSKVLSKAIHIVQSLQFLCLENLKLGTNPNIPIILLLFFAIKKFNFFLFP